MGVWRYRKNKIKLLFRKYDMKFFNYLKIWSLFYIDSYDLSK